MQIYKWLSAAVMIYFLPPWLTLDRQTHRQAAFDQIT